MYKDLVPARTNTKKRVLDDFAAQVEEKLAKAKGPDAMAAIVCRLLTSKDQRISALMVCKWIEWRYGKPKENAESIRAFAIQIINHIPRPGEIAPAPSDGDLGAEIARESNETSDTKIIQAEPKSKQ